MKNLLIFILVAFFSHSVFSESEFSRFIKKGLKANEDLFQFIVSHPCQLGADQSCERALSAREMQTLKQVFLNLEVWRKLSFDGIVSMADLIVDTETDVVLGDRLMITRTDKKLKISLNPSDPASREFLLRAKSGTATMMLLYDSFFRLAEVLAKSKKLRRIIEFDMPHEGTALENTYELALNGELWDKSTHSLKFLTKAKSLISSQDDTEDLIFDQYLAQSFVAQKMLEGDLDFRFKRILFLEGQLRQGRFFDKIYTFMGLLSKFFGNTAGLFQTRSGKLKHLVKNPQDLNSIKSKLKPLSILLEKTPFRLTDHFIPGYFGHVAIWLGTIDELKPLKVPFNGKSIPLLNHPDVLPHLKNISEGRSILEAVRLSGVSLNSVENFLDIDDLVIMEGASMSQDEQALHLLRAFQQIGKPYDFNFNVESEREIICSELVYMVFLNENWPTSRSAGRFTISPDQVAWRGVDSCFHPVLMYLSGKKVELNLKDHLERVLRLPGGIENTSSGSCPGL